MNVNHEKNHGHPVITNPESPNERFPHPSILTGAVPLHPRPSASICGSKFISWALATFIAAVPAMRGDSEPEKIAIVPPPPGTELPEATPERIDAAIRAGVDFLIQDQNANGSWGGPTQTKGLNIYAPGPGSHRAFRAGATGLAISGMIDARDSRPEAAESIARAAEWVIEEMPNLRRAHPTVTYNNWGHAYGLRAITRLNRYDPERGETWKALAQQQVEFASRFAEVNGGWGYLDLGELNTQRPSGTTTAFTSATMLLAMAEARDALGIELDAAAITPAIRSIRDQQTPDFAYVYSLPHQWVPRRPINRPAGSLARSQVCNAALRAFGNEAITDEVIITWADRFLEREGWLSIARKRPRPHDIHFQISGYFYYYGIFYFTEAVSLLPEEHHARYAKTLAQILLERQEKDGSWWDYPLYAYHQPYGTGYALMALSWCREVMK